MTTSLCPDCKQDVPYDHNCSARVPVVTYNGDGEITSVEFGARSWKAMPTAPSLRRTIELLRQEMGQMRTELAFAQDAASKGDAARLQAGGMELEIAELKEQLEKSQNAMTEVVTQLNEADRRAGAAERKYEQERESAFKRDQWLDKAKQDWGVHTHTSFDDIWRKALYHKHRLALMIPLFQEARDAITVIRLHQARQRGLDLDLATRMDAVGHLTFEDFAKSRGWYVKQEEKKSDDEQR